MPFILFDLPAPAASSPATGGNGQKERQEDGDQVHRWQGGEEDEEEGEDSGPELDGPL